MKYLKLLIIITLMTSFIGCKDLIEVKPEGVGTLDNIMVDANTAVMALNGTLDNMTSVYQRDYQSYTYFASDDGYVKSPNYNWVDYEVLNPRESEFLTIWQNFYAAINRCNIILSRLPNVPFKTAEVSIKNTVKGQALFIRAFSYYSLLRTVGGVPLITEELTTPDAAKVARAPMIEVYNRVVADLLEAITLLPESMTGQFSLEYGKPCKYAANALLADVYLTYEKFPEALAQANAVISSAKYAIMPRALIFSHNVTKDYNADYNKDVIWDINFAGPSFSQRFSYAWCNIAKTPLAGPVGSFGISQSFIADLDLVNDNRLASYLEWDNVQKVYWCLKLWNGEPQMDQALSFTNYPIYRIPEMFLIKAEAILRSNGPIADVATALNAVRTSAGLPAIANPTLNDILKERRVELCFENKRYYDLNRLDLLKEKKVNLMNASAQTTALRHFGKNTITNKDMFFFPIPQAEINANPKLGGQNPGY